MEQTKFCETLLALRTSRAETQEQVASALGISNKTLSKWENGSSLPDLPTLCSLADYYGVSTDRLLGRACEKAVTAASAIREEMSERSRKDALLYAFSLFHELVIGGYHTMSRSPYGGAVVPAHFLSDHPSVTRSLFSSEDAYGLIVNSAEVNLALLLLGNESDFSWLDEPEKRAQIASLFELLSDEDALKIGKALYSRSCPAGFTALYMGEIAGVDAEKATAILERACRCALCSRRIAHLREGETVVYTSYAEGRVLALITLAFEHMCGKQAHQYAYHGQCRMIGGKEA